MYIKFNDQDVSIEAKEIISVEGVVKITLTDTSEISNNSGFNVYDDKESTCLIGNYSEFTTIYCSPEPGIVYLSTGIVHVPGDKIPIEPEKALDLKQQQIDTLLASMDYIMLEVLPTLMV